jgi:hypothetical protein
LHDWDWALRAVERVHVERLDEPLLRYRAHGANTIAEVATWKKIVENAYIFAGCVRRVGIDGMAAVAGVEPSDVMRALTKNGSFRPVPTLFVASLHWSDAELEAALADGRLEAMLRPLVERDGRHVGLLGCAASIDDAMHRDEHLLRLLLGWRPVRRFRKVMRIARRDIKKGARGFRRGFRPES